MTGAHGGAAVFAPFLRKLKRHVALDVSEQDGLVAAFGTPRRILKGEVIAAESRGGETVTLMLEGLAFSSRGLPNGQRQTVALHLAGDLVDATAFIAGVERPVVTALTSGTAATIGYARLRTLVCEQPRVGLALWSDMVADSVIAQEWLLGLGKRPALQNVAHFICELHARSRAGLGAGASFPFPLTQEQLAETLGLSVVHLNRVLQQLRREGLITLSRGSVTILEADVLSALAGFDPVYLSPPAPAFLKSPIMTGMGASRIEALEVGS